MVSILKQGDKFLYLKSSPEKHNSVILDNQEINALHQFRYAISKIEALKDYPNDDETLLRFLRAKNFNIGKSVSLIKNYLEWQRTNSELFNIPFTECQAVYESGLFSVLKERDAEGRKIIVAKSILWSAETVPVETCIMALYYIFEELTLTSEETQKNGILFILDNTSTSFQRMVKMVSQFTLKNCIRLISFYQGSFPCKLKGIHSLSTPILISTTYGAVKYLLTAKLRSRVKLHAGDSNTLPKHVSFSNVPEMFGGSVPDVVAKDADIFRSLYKRRMN